MFQQPERKVHETVISVRMCQTKGVRSFIQTTLKRQVKSRKRTRHLKTVILAIEDVELSEQTVLDPRTWDGPSSRRAARRSPRAHLELINTNTPERFINVRGQLGPSLGVIQGGPKHHRNPNTCVCRQIQTTRCGQKTVREKKLGNGSNSCREIITERTWRTKLQFSYQRWSGEQLPQPSVLTRDSLLLMLVLFMKVVSKTDLSPEEQENNDDYL